MREGAVERAWDRMSHALEALEAARLLLDAGSLAAAINRAYYAAFYAACALLETRGMGGRSHRGLLTLFGREFVVPGIIAREHGRALHKLFERRQEADYGVFVDFDQETTADLVEAAEAFVTDARELLERLLADRS